MSVVTWYCAVSCGVCGDVVLCGVLSYAVLCSVLSLSVVSCGVVFCCVLWCPVVSHGSCSFYSAGGSGVLLSALVVLI